MIKSNFILRALTGALFVGVMAGAILWNHISFLVLFLVISVMTVWEFAGIMNRSGRCELLQRTSAVGAILLFASFAVYSMTDMPVIFSVYMLYLLYVMILELYRKSEKAVENIAFFFMGQVYVALPFSLLNLSVMVGNGYDTISYSGAVPMLIFAFLWLNDTGAYCVGSLLGKHRLFERISPKKSWEGFFGGAAFALAGGYAASLIIDMFTPGMLVGMAAVVVVSGTLGDLVESLIKRQIGIKDSGNVIPGHGGMLDRFDSSLFAIPAVTIYIYSLYLY